MYAAAKEGGRNFPRPPSKKSDNCFLMKNRLSQLRG